MPDRMFTTEEVEDRIRQERQAQKVHDVNGQIQGQTAAQQIAAALAPLLAAKPPTEKDVPGWIKVSGAVCALFVSGAAVLGIVWSVAIGPVQTRLDVLEKADVAQLATITSLNTRMSAADSKIAQLETTITTAGRIRDQQQQGIADQVRGLSAADQQATERLATLSNTIASILPRLEEILRRQERLENRLGAQRAQPNSDETPTALWQQPQPVI
jgi:hypothetical protein